MIRIIATLQNDLGLREKDYYIWSHSILKEIYKTIGINHDIMIDEDLLIKSPSFLNKKKIIVLSSNNLEVNYDVICYDKIDEIVYQYYESDRDIYIIGGSNIYKEFLPFVEEIDFYFIEGNDECVEFFPHLKPKEWKNKEASVIDENIVYEKYVRRKVKK